MNLHKDHLYARLLTTFEAIPRITDEFHSLTSVGWYGSAYLLTCCALQLIFGKIYTLFSVKWTLLWSILVFEASSALSGAAPNSTALIVGRAISGVGAAGIFAGVVGGTPLSPSPLVMG
jgi:MFS family permease